MHDIQEFLIFERQSVFVVICCSHEHVESKLVLRAHVDERVAGKVISLLPAVACLVFDVYVICRLCLCVRVNRCSGSGESTG